MDYGNWRFNGRNYGAITSDQPTGIDDEANVEAYGGHLVCETVAPKVRPLLLAAPHLLDACKVALDVEVSRQNPDVMLVAILKAAVMMVEGEL